MTTHHLFAAISNHGNKWKIDANVNANDSVSVKINGMRRIILYITNEVGKKATKTMMVSYIVYMTFNLMVKGLR